MEKIIFDVIRYDSKDYNEAVSLRERILRHPLGLSFSPDQLAQEKNYIHFAGYADGKICATASLVPEGETCKMQQVAVCANNQGKGVGSALLEYCEQYAKKHGFKEIYCYARKTALDFYLRNNYHPEGNFFMKIGLPHVKMTKKLLYPDIDI